LAFGVIGYEAFLESLPDGFVPNASSAGFVLRLLLTT